MTLSFSRTKLVGMTKTKAFFYWLIFVLVLAGCGIMQQRQEEDQLRLEELQSDIQRFTGVFIDRINQALTIIEENREDLSSEVLRRQLLYTSAAVEIAAGEDPAANLLDMMTFLYLAGDRVEKHWKPRVFDKKGSELAQAFADSKVDLNRIARRALTQNQIQEFESILNDWNRENADLILVERVRLAEIQGSGPKGRARSSQIQGILDSLRQAITTADEGVLLADRALFLSKHYPDLIRMQARLGTGQILADSLQTLSEANEELGKLSGQANPLVKNLTALTAQAGATARQAESLLGTFRSAFPQQQTEEPVAEGEGLDLDKLNAIVVSLKDMMANLEGSAREAEAVIRSGGNSLEEIVWTAAFAFLLAGTGLGVVWWGGYYLAKRGLANRASS